MKAVINTGGKQYVVEKGDVLEVELLGDTKSLSFEAMLVIDDKKVSVGTPTVKGATVKAKLLENTRADKVTAIRYKAKKRVHKRKGHKQPLSKIEISSINLK